MICIRNNGYITIFVFYFLVVIEKSLDFHFIFVFNVCVMVEPIICQVETLHKSGILIYIYIFWILELSISILFIYITHCSLLIIRKLTWGVLIFNFWFFFLCLSVQKPREHVADAEVLLEIIHIFFSQLVFMCDRVLSGQKPLHHLWALLEVGDRLLRISFCLRTLPGCIFFFIGFGWICQLRVWDYHSVAFFLVFFGYVVGRYLRVSNHLNDFQPVAIVSVHHVIRCLMWGLSEESLAPDRLASKL